MYAYNTKVSNLQGFTIYCFGWFSMLLTFDFLSYILLSLWCYSFQFSYHSSCWMSIPTSVKMLRQGPKLLNTGYLFVLKTLFHQTSNLSFPFGNGNSESVTYLCISHEYSPQPLDKKVSKYGFKFKKFLCFKDDLRNCGSKSQKNLRRGLFKPHSFWV